MKYDNKIIENILVKFIRNETSRIGISKAVVGLSGGIDSAVSAFLSERALGKDNVICIMMPYKTSSPENLRDAENLAKKLKVKSKVVNISKMVDSYLEGLDGEVSNVRKGNIMARMRMIVLYDESSRENAIVMGTGNKTEILLGYTTIYGDSACGINPIGDLYKTQIWELAKYLEIPEEIIRKKPSADLWVGQTDEGELGFTYSEVDKFLYYKIDERKSDEELLKLGFNRDFIEKVNTLIIKNQYKRVPPLVARISNSTVNTNL